MAESAASLPPRAIARSSAWREPGLLLLLLALAGGIHAWLICHTEVTAGDGIVFIRYAWQLRHQPWQQVLSANHQHPGYPLAIAAVSVPLCRILGATDCDTMMLSAQLTSALAGSLLVIPMFYLGRELFNRRVGFWTAALLQCLPVVAHVTSDALSEGVFLLAASVAMLLAVRAFQGNSAVRFGLCALAGGLAYLVRPEGALIVVATGLVLLGMQAVPGWRRPWRKALTCTATLLLVSAAVASPFLAATGRITTKPNPQKIIDSICSTGTGGTALGRTGTLTLGPLGPERPPHRGDASAGRPPVASTLGVYWSGQGDRLWWGIWALLTEIIKDFHYFPSAAALFGLYWYHDRLRLFQGAWMVLLLCVLHAVVLWRLALLKGYVSERHVLIIVLCGLYPAVAAVHDFPRLVRSAWEKLGRLVARNEDKVRQGSARFLRTSPLSAVLLLALAAPGLPKVFQPLHPTHSGHRAAGLWLADHSQPADVIVDPSRWATYFAGRVLQDPGTDICASGLQATRYVVVDDTRDLHDQISEAIVAETRELMGRGKVVYEWKPTQRFRGRGGTVRVYCVPPGTAPRKPDGPNS